MAHDKKNLTTRDTNDFLSLFSITFKVTNLFSFTSCVILSVKIVSNSHQISFSLQIQLKYIVQKIFCLIFITFLFDNRCFLFVLSRTVMMREHISCHCHVPNACCSNNMIYQIIT